MKQDKYMGMDVHQATTVVAVRDARGKLVFETIVETEAGSITRLLQGLSGPMHVGLEETTQSGMVMRADAAVGERGGGVQSAAEQMAARRVEGR